MFSDKKSVLLLAASLKAYNIKHIVLSPGSRNAPLLHTFSQDPFFHCHSLIDERGGAFFALGLIEKLRTPVAICCTSGTALLNYGPAIGEAFYQHLPLVVISADRTEAWIGQQDGQTIVQPDLFRLVIKKSVQLPQIHNSEEEWYCQRLLHESLLACEQTPAGPVHINVPISEPLFNFTVPELPLVQRIQRVKQLSELNLSQQHFNRCLIVVGQLPQNHQLTELLSQLNCVILSEYLSNIPAGMTIGNFDLILATADEHELSELVPDLLITFGDHVVSKRLKQFLRKNRPKAHWLFRESGDVIDLFQSLSAVVAQPIEASLQQLAGLLPTDDNGEYKRLWAAQSDSLQFDYRHYPFCDFVAMGAFLQQLPEHSSLQLANSSSVRHAQLFKIKPDTEIFCNRGTNGIDGTLSTAMGIAALNDRITFLALGDLSFFYDLNALSCEQMAVNLRIILFNNQGGAIFYGLPGAQQSPALGPYIARQHQNQAEAWAKAANIEYLSATDLASLQQQLPYFVDSEVSKPILLEVFTSIQEGTDVLRQLITDLKKRKNEQK